MLLKLLNNNTFLPTIMLSIHTAIGWIFLFIDLHRVRE